MSPIDPDLRIGSVELAVSDLERSADFYERVLGLPLIERGQRTAQLGEDALAPALVLSAIAEGRARGLGQMPALLYQGKEAEEVASFVAAVAGH